MADWCVHAEVQSNGLELVITRGRHAQALENPGTSSERVRVRSNPELTREWLSRGKMWTLSLPSRLNQGSKVDCDVSRDLAFVLGENRCVSFMEEQWLEDGPDGGIVPVLAEDVGGVRRSRDVVESEDSSCNGFSCAMVGEGIVAFLQLGVGNRSCVDDRFIISKHHVLAINGDS